MDGVRQWAFRVTLCAAVAWLMVLCGQAEAREGRTYRVQGIVIAVTLNQTPLLVVVDTPITPKNHMTVGAAVTGQTKLTRAGKRMPIQALKVGDSVWLTYVKSPTGLIAKSIDAKG